jgi:predicted tellurium resistance membrane protein TerC
MAEKFHFLKYGLAFVLSFIGVKMLLPLLAEGLIMVVSGDSSAGRFLQSYLHHDYEQAVINVSLGIVIGTIILSIILSLIFPHKSEEQADED